MSEQTKDPVFTDGLIFKKPHANAPDFVKLDVSVKVSEFIAFLQKNEKNGWVNFQLKKSKKGGLYGQLDTWEKPNTEQPPVDSPEETERKANLQAEIDKRVPTANQEVPAGEQIDSPF